VGGRWVVGGWWVGGWWVVGGGWWVVGGWLVRCAWCMVHGALLFVWNLVHLLFLVCVTTSVWNPLYLRTDAAVKAMAAEYGVREGEILDRDVGNLATRAVLVETHVIKQTKDFLERVRAQVHTLSPSSTLPPLATVRWRRREHTRAHAVMPTRVCPCTACGGG
jgi:hypothetical protein